MLHRTVVKPHVSKHKQSWKTYVECGKCGHKNPGSTFKLAALTSMSVLKCFNCDESLDNHDHLSKKVSARLSYHKSK